MKIINTISEMQAYSTAQRKADKTIGLVPTMGFLHEGHLSLVDKARQHADIVIVTIFVNPTQFGPNEDLDRYPRDFEGDCHQCETRNVDAIFAPTVDEMYPEKQTCWVNEDELSLNLCGKSRPGHFRGVTSVVTKLFNACLPDIAVFGQKDAQQAAILKKMVLDLNFPIKVIVAPIVRESDGLALSSRNKYLSDDEHQRSLSINLSLEEAEKAIANGERNPNTIHDLITKMIAASGGNIDYVEIVDNKTLSSVSELTGEILIAVAVFYGKTRLIDNSVIQVG